MTTNLRLGNLLAIVLLGGVGACTTQAVTTGAGGSGGTTTTGTGGSTDGGSANGIVCLSPKVTNNTLPGNPGIACPKPATSGLIADFTFPADAGVPDGGAPPRFGDDSTVLSGGGSTYANMGGMISQDSSKGDWHIQGTVGNYAGFSLYFDDLPNASQQNMLCNMVDATGFTGISFTIWGTTANNPINMAIGIVDDTPPPSWFTSIGAATSTMPIPAGACIPDPNGMQYYHPGCTAPNVNINIPAGATSAATAQTVTLKWTDFTGGACKPNVVPDQIVSVAWQFAWSPPTTAYAVDIHIDDLKFITN